MFRFTIRDVLWLTVVMGLAVGWWLDRAPRVAFISPAALGSIAGSLDEMVKVTIVRGGYDAESEDGRRIRQVRVTVGDSN
jgi:hypothetical protein